MSSFLQTVLQNMPRVVDALECTMRTLFVSSLVWKNHFVLDPIYTVQG